MADNISRPQGATSSGGTVITINAYYRKPRKKDFAQPITAKTPVFRNIRIAHLTATCPKAAGMIVGLPERPVTDVVLEDVRISAPTGMVIRNAQNITLKNVRVEARESAPSSSRMPQ